MVATMGYSQVKKMSLTRSDGELDYTTYDWQTNWGNINRTIVWPDGKISFAYTFASDNNHTDMGTSIGTYDSNTDEWIPLNGRIENEKTNFGSIARYQENSIVVAANTITTCGIYIVEDKDDMSPNSVPAASYINGAYDPHCPVVMTSGANRDIIHIIATGSDNKLYYFRSTNGGLTWDKENEILPFLTEEYGSDWGDNIAYWMETTEDNCLALVVNNPWSDGMVIYSYDNGETWERKVFYHHPGINTTFDDLFMYPRWASCVWGVDNELCLAYEFNGSIGEPGSDIYYPGIGGVAFWSESMPYQGTGQPFTMDSEYIKELWDSSPYFHNPPYQMWPEYIGYIESEWDSLGFHLDDFTLHGDYKCGPVAMPVLCKVPNTDNFLVAVWIALDENTMDYNGNYYFKLWASVSLNGGLTWTHQIQLIDDFMFQYSECVYPQVAVVGTTLVVVCQMDGESGTYIMEDDLDPSNNYFQGLTFDIMGFIPPVPPPGNAEWYYEIEWDDSITYQHLECAGDTTIGNERPKIIVRSNTQYDRDTIIEVTHEYIYDDNGIVYWWNKDLEEFTTLYDLTADVGDEWEIKVGTESLTMHVDAVELYEYEGKTYRILRVSDPDDLFSGDIVCGIGHLTSFFPERLMNRDKGYRVDGLRCYWIGDELIFKMGDEDCDAVYSQIHGIEEDGPSTGSGTLTVYPNPTNGVLFVETHGRASQLPAETYRITNLMGQTVLSGNITAENQQINIEKLPAGMYFINVNEQTAKFVKQ